MTVALVVVVSLLALVAVWELVKLSCAWSEQKRVEQRDRERRALRYSCPRCNAACAPIALNDEQIAARCPIHGVFDV